MLEVLAAALAIAATTIVVELVFQGIFALWQCLGKPKEMPVADQVEMSEKDKQKIDETQQLIQECFGENVVENLKNASNKERIALMAEFAEKLAELYDLDIEVDVTISDAQNCGFYNWQEKKAKFNILLLTIDSSNEHFEYCVREVMDTIIHELRHAVQHKAILEEGFWEIEDERRAEWANNMTEGNYIRPEVDMKGYVNQPIEADASTFAGLVMNGVH